MDQISSSWKLFERHLAAGGSATDLGFTSSDGDVSRFLARYRVAAAFRSVELEGFSKATAQTYSSLLRLFLTWSAFENYCTIAGMRGGRGELDHDAIRAFVNDHPTSVTLTTDSGPADGIRRFLADSTTSRALAERLEPGKACEPYDLYLGLRHSFVHGPLTAHAGGSKPKRLQRDAEELATWLLGAMERGFEAFVQSST